MKENVLIQQLYYRYNRVSDEEIKKHLHKLTIVKKKNGKYYPLNKTAIGKIKKKPRNVSLTFDATGTSKTPIIGLIEKKTITYLVKSTSRFFLKPDVGEILDQIHWEDFYDKDFKAICFNEGYETLEGTEGEHFLMTATLLYEDDKSDAINKLHSL